MVRNNGIIVSFQVRFSDTENVIWVGLKHCFAIFLIYAEKSVGQNEVTYLNFHSHSENFKCTSALYCMHTDLLQHEWVFSS